MTLPVFADPDLRASEGQEFDLTGPEGHHAAVVRRIGVGEQVQVTDGRGRTATCGVLAASKTGLRLVVQELSTTPAPSPVITVIQAIPKGDRSELTVEVLTEVGADTIVPWAASRSVGQWRGERAAKALAKWRTTAREAAKQSRRSWFPEVTDQVDLEGALRIVANADVAVVLHEEGERPLGALELAGAGSIVVIVGPEGGIAPAELDAFAAAGASVCRLGTTVLRTSTAGVAGLAALLAATRWS